MSSSGVEDVDSNSDYVPSQYTVGKEVETEAGDRYWIPEVEERYKPVEGTIFDSVAQALKFYKEYGRKGGFEVRKSTQKHVRVERDQSVGHVIKLKYFVCSREGFKPNKAEHNVVEANDKSYLEHHTNDESLGENNITDESVGENNVTDDLGNQKRVAANKQKRKTASQRIGCEASVRLQITHDNKYELYHFEEKHNHGLVHPKYMKHLRACRRLTYSQKRLLHDMANASIGPTVGHRVLSKIHGGLEEVGATATDCRNFKRDVTSFIGKADAQIVVDMLKKKKECLPGFSFDYFVSNGGKLGGLFWADEQVKRNYDAFGDVVSFDATFRSNKYNMVFVPFTGIDNHKRCVTFGAGMLINENVFSYTWLLNAFKRSFPREPKIVLTDQDPAMKIAIKDVFVSARHQLCMWHIMEKLSTKVGAAVCNSGFKELLCRIVWTDKLEPHEFDQRWVHILKEYKLQDHGWLADMFEMRSKWIPAYFRDWPMSGLMRTSSRSESENHMFGQLMKSSSTLVEFFTFFDTAMQGQRFTQSKNDHESMYTTPNVNPDVSLEKDAVVFYTRSVFFDVQREMAIGRKYCMSESLSEEGGSKKYIVVDTTVVSQAIDDKIDRAVDETYFDELLPTRNEVVFNPADQLIVCTCKRYERSGLLCRHIFYVLKLCNVSEFPKKYICRRWTQNVVSVQSGANLNQFLDQKEEMRTVIRDIYSNVDYCVNRLMCDSDRLAAFRDSQQQLVEITDAEMGSQPAAGSNEFIGAMLGLEHPETITIHPPENVVNKGGGKRNRLEGSREQAMKKAKKQLRVCRYCGHLAYHDSRNCPVRKGDEANAATKE